MKTYTASLALLGAVSMLAGCPEYFTVEEACHPKDAVGKNNLGNVELEAVNRLNCYRRLSGVLRASARQEVQEAAAGQVSYILANPDSNRVFGPDGPKSFLSQVFDDPEYTGSNIFERLETAGYTFTDIRGTAIAEYIYIAVDDQGVGTPTGAEAMDFLMREHNFRQVGLQPSWIDGGYTEAVLTREWWINSRYCDFVACVDGEPPANLTGKVYYMIAIHDQPHIEHADRPLVFPKNEQTLVPLYSHSENLQTIDTLGYPEPVQVSYPITLFGGVLDPSNARPGDQNIYGLEVIASVVEVGVGPLETQIVLPGSQADKVWPDGLQLRQIASIFTRAPLTPNTAYQMFADVTTAESTFAIDIEFRTAPDDPGVILGDNLTTTTLPSARSASLQHTAAELEAYVVEHPQMDLRRRR